MLDQIFKGHAIQLEAGEYSETGSSCWITKTPRSSGLRGLWGYANAGVSGGGEIDLLGIYQLTWQTQKMGFVGLPTSGAEQK